MGRWWGGDVAYGNRLRAQRDANVSVEVHSTHNINAYIYTYVLARTEWVGLVRTQHVYTYTYTFIRAYIHTYIHTYNMYTHARTHTHTCIYMHVYTHLCRYIHRYTWYKAHLLTHTHTTAANNHGPSREVASGRMLVQKASVKVDRGALEALGVGLGGWWWGGGRWGRE